MTGLGNADDVYKHYLKVIEENKQFEKKLEIAVKALEFYANESHFGDTQYGINGENEWWYEGNVENGTKAEKALAKIKELDK